MPSLEFTEFTQQTKGDLEEIATSDSVEGYEAALIAGFRRVTDQEYLSRKLRGYNPRVYTDTYNYTIRDNKRTIGFLAIWNGVRAFAPDQSPDIDFWMIDASKVDSQMARAAVYEKLQRVQQSRQ